MNRGITCSQISCSERIITSAGIAAPKFSSVPDLNEIIALPQDEMRDVYARFTSGAGGIFHDHQTETYIIVSGGGTLVTGGHIVNGRKSAADSEVTTVLNGPSIR